MTQRTVTPGDVQIRLALRSWLLVEHARETETVVIEELGICRGHVRVDVAVVNGLLHGYEIKSDRDSLRRLKGQVKAYSRVLDRATLVVGDRHLAAALQIVPPWWGVLRIGPSQEGRPRFKTVRRGRKNREVDPRSLVELLWLDDSISLLARHNVARGVRGKPRHVVWDRICDNFGIEKIAAAVRANLKVRAASQDPR